MIPGTSISSGPNSTPNVQSVDLKTILPDNKPVQAKVVDSQKAPDGSSNQRLTLQIGKQTVQVESKQSIPAGTTLEATRKSDGTVELRQPARVSTGTGSTREAAITARPVTQLPDKVELKPANSGNNPPITRPTTGTVVDSRPLAGGSSSATPASSTDGSSPTSRPASGSNGNDTARQPAQTAQQSDRQPPSSPAVQPVRSTAARTLMQLATQLGQAAPQPPQAPQQGTPTNTLLQVVAGTAIQAGSAQPNAVSSTAPSPVPAATGSAQPASPATPTTTPAGTGGSSAISNAAQTLPPNTATSAQPGTTSGTSSAATQAPTAGNTQGTPQAQTAATPGTTQATTPAPSPGITQTQTSAPTQPSAGTSVMPPSASATQATAAQTTATPPGTANTGATSTQAAVPTAPTSNSAGPTASSQQIPQPPASATTPQQSAPSTSQRTAPQASTTLASGGQPPSTNSSQQAVSSQPPNQPALATTNSSGLSSTTTAPLNTGTPASTAQSPSGPSTTQLPPSGTTTPGTATTPSSTNTANTATPAGQTTGSSSITAPQAQSGSASQTTAATQPTSPAGSSAPLQSAQSVSNPVVTASQAQSVQQQSSPGGGVSSTVITPSQTTNTSNVITTRPGLEHPHQVTVKTSDGASHAFNSPRAISTGTRLLITPQPGGSVQAQALPPAANSPLTSTEQSQISDRLRQTLPQQIPTGDAFSTLQQMIGSGSQLATRPQVTNAVRSLLNLFGVSPGADDTAAQIRQNVELGGRMTEGRMLMGKPGNRDMKRALTQLRQLSEQLPDAARGQLDQLMQKLQARQTSQQLLSLQQWKETPDGGLERVIRTDIPVRQGEEFDNVELTITEEKPPEDDARFGSQWRVQLQFDLERKGHVMVELVIQKDEQLSGSFWAERRETAAEIRNRMAQFVDHLDGNGFDVQEMHCHLGRPPGEKETISRQLIDLKT